MLRPTAKTAEPITLDFSSSEMGFSKDTMGEHYQIQTSQLTKTWRTSALLQTTLDIKSMLSLFSVEVNNSVHHSGLTYHHADSKTEVHIGKVTKQKCRFQLLIEHQSLGEITFLRGKPFTLKERSQLEFLLASLVYPLRNALQYLTAYQSSVTDPLTGKSNRLILNATLKHEVGLFHRYKIPLTLMVLDVDNFKKINDEHGHACGDEVIKAIADTVSDCVRETDTLVRYGGDEFVILLSNTSAQGAQRISEHIRDTLAKLELSYQGQTIHFTSSIGCASLTDGDVGNSLFMRADNALLVAKKSGRNRTCYS